MFLNCRNKPANPPSGLDIRVTVHSVIATMLRKCPFRLLVVAPAILLAVAAQLGTSTGAEAPVAADGPGAFCAQCGWSDTA